MKLLIVVVVFTMATESFAQKFGVKAGLNLSNMLAKDDHETNSDQFKMTPGFHIGPTLEIPINEMISIETGLLLSTKGFKMTEKDGGDEYKVTANPWYIDLQLTPKVSFNVGGPKIYAVLGPYIGIGLTGKFKYKETYNGTTTTDDEDILWGSDAEEDDLKRLDFGLVAGAGVEFGFLQIGMSYGLGLANISPYTDEGTKGKNRVLGISVGLKFGGK